MPLLTITVGGVSVHSDAVLYETPGASEFSTDRYHTPNYLHAMSIIGPEQSVRAIAAICSMPDANHGWPPNRAKMLLLSPNGVRMVVRWAGEWRARAVLLTRGAMHLVAMPEVTVTSLTQQQMAEKSEKASMPSHVIIAEPDGDLETALYERLMMAYSTPLIPLDQPGQTDEERRVGREWRRVITSEIMRSSGHWRALKIHKEQPDKRWSMAGRLSLTQGTLDALVSRLTRSGSLPFPRLSATSGGRRRTQRAPSTESRSSPAKT